MAKCYSKIAVHLIAILSLFDSLSASSSKLKEDLLRDYDKDKYPGDVTVIPEVTYRVCPTLDSDGIMTYEIKEHYEWNDNRLHWNPGNYGDVHDFDVPLKNLWVPDIKLSETSRIDEVDGLASSNLDLTAKVVCTGNVKVDRFSRYRTRCYARSDVENVLDCTVKLGSMATYEEETTTFTMERSKCNTDLFGLMMDQCRDVVLTRETDIETYSLDAHSPTTYWFVVRLKLHKKARRSVDFL